MSPLHLCPVIFVRQWIRLEFYKELTNKLYAFPNQIDWEYIDTSSLINFYKSIQHVLNSNTFATENKDTRH